MITIKELDGKEKPKLLLHCCCAPCSSYVLQYLNNYFRITAFFYNPNIEPLDEFQLRLKELKRMIKEMGLDVIVIEGPYDDSFSQIARGLETEKEGGNRCFKCYRLRLEETVKYAYMHHFDVFTTTLSVSPYKKADKLNEIGIELEEKYHVSYLYSDFKKNDGYKKTIEYSKEYSLYRQNYCGCVYSKRD